MKLADLAVFGGAPAFDPPVHVGRPNLPDRAQFVAAMSGIFDRVILTNDGPEVRRLEERFRQLAGTTHAVAVCNATLGLQLVAKALDLQGRVLMPAFSFVATAHAFKWVGLEPVFCDVDPTTHNLDVLEAERHLAAGDIAAVVGVHLWGRLCPPALEKICRDHGVPLIFDAAHATGCSGHGRPAGSFGTAEVFSLHATKICNAFEGGVITTNDDTLARRLRQMRNFGFSGYDRVDSLGINAKMSEAAAAMGLLSLQSLNDYCVANAGRQRRYREQLASVPGLKFVSAEAGHVSNQHYVVIEFDSRWPDDARDAAYHALHAEGVLARRYFYPGIHRHEPYRHLPTGRDARLPQTEALCRRILCLPNGPTLPIPAVDRISELLRVILADVPAVHAQLRRLGRSD